MDCTQEFKHVAEGFQIAGEVISVLPYGNGHINRTLLVTTTQKRYILQRINTKVFPDTDVLMNNIVMVTEHLQRQGIETLRVVPTVDNKSYLKGEDCYRMYDFIEHSVTFQTADSLEVFAESGRAFGAFQNYLSAFDASKLVEIIPHFHDTPKRFDDFCKALEQNASGRAHLCQKEIDFVLARKDTFAQITNALQNGTLPLRVTHNDTKLNNVLLDAATHKARAVIDLDTIMPGSMLYDFGDSIRFGASTAAEDEQDLTKVHFSLQLFRAYAEGYLGQVKNSVTPQEALMMPVGAYMMTVECGMRFLADYIQGDTYFATKYPEHNLVRCRTQFKLVAEMETQTEQMRKIIEEILN